MKTIKYLFAGIVVCILFFLPYFDIDHNYINHLLISFGIMVLLGVININESIDKIQNINSPNIRITKGLTYCFCSLPYMFFLLNRQHSDSFINWSIMIYFLTLIIAIFNFGIEVKKDIKNN